MVRNELKEVWNGRRLVPQRKLKIVTTSSSVVEFERHGRRDERGGISQTLFLLEFT